MNETQLLRAVEALVFLSPEPLSLVRLCELTEAAPGPVQRALAELAARHDASSGVELAEIAGGWVLRTQADLGAVCDRLRARPPQERLSPAALETLAVIAYLEPISRPEVARVRGVSAEATVASLLERGMIEEAGRASDGVAMRYRTTPAFQERFGLKGPHDLPSIAQFELSGAEAEAVRQRLRDAGYLPDEVV